MNQSVNQSQKFMVWCLVHFSVNTSENYVFLSALICFAGHTTFLTTSSLYAAKSTCLAAIISRYFLVATRVGLFTSRLSYKKKQTSTKSKIFRRVIYPTEVLVVSMFAMGIHGNIVGFHGNMKGFHGNTREFHEIFKGFHWDFMGFNGHVMTCHEMSDCHGI